MTAMEYDPNPHRAYISLGSNMDDRLGALEGGIAALASSDTAVVSRSRFYQTSPVGDADQAWYLNCVVAVETRLPPLELLQCCLDIERRAGRVRTRRRYGPRVLDLDILIYDDWIIAGPQLTIPHPRMHERRFVLRPLCDIDPELQHPVLHKSVCVLLQALEDPTQKIEEYACDC